MPTALPSPAPAIPAPATPAPHIRSLDGLRGIAILMVMFSHFCFIGENLSNDVPIERLLLSGYLGVDLFFVLSGFLITGILLDHQHRQRYLRVFYWRRALRIFPLYYFVLLLAMASVHWLSPADVAKQQGLDAPWWHWLYLSNVAIMLKQTWLNSPQWIQLSHFWSLAVEEQFYLCWPFLVRGMKRRHLWWLCLALIGCSPLLGMWMRHQFGDVGGYVATPTRLGALAMGALLALAWRQPSTPRWQQLGATPLSWLAGITVFLLLAARSVIPAISAIEMLLATIAAGALLLMAVNLRHPRWQRFLENPLLCTVGKYSYGLYVYHHAFKALWHHWLWKKWIEPAWGDGWFGIGCYVLAAGAASFGIAWISWRCFEAPLLKLKDRVRCTP